MRCFGWTVVDRAPTTNIIAIVIRPPALQPFLERISDDERCSFLDHYRKELHNANARHTDGKVLFSYPRLFIVAVKS